MQIVIKEYSERYADQSIALWNEVVREGVAFPQTEPLCDDGFFKEQSLTAVALCGQTDELVGLYILHPNNVGRCGHICNASYAVKGGHRGEHIGEQLVRHCMSEARRLGFRILQFNAVVCTNAAALALYKKLGFVQLGTIPAGFLSADGSYQDIIPHYCVL